MEKYPLDAPSWGITFQIMFREVDDIYTLMGY